MISISAVILSHPPLYLDPGSGSILIQLLLAVILGAGIAIKVFWNKITTLFRGNKATISKIDEEENDE
jgi:hypothetical protein